METPAAPQPEAVPLTRNTLRTSLATLTAEHDQVAEAQVAVLLSDEALVAEVARRNAQRQAQAKVPLEGQTYIGDRFLPAECQPGRCDHWAKGDVLHRHWRDQETGLAMTTPGQEPPTAVTGAGGITSVEV